MGALKLIREFQNLTYSSARNNLLDAAAIGNAEVTERSVFLEISPYEADGGELIGKRPEDVLSRDFSPLLQGEKSPEVPFEHDASTAAAVAPAKSANVFRRIAPLGPSAWERTRSEPSAR